MTQDIEIPPTAKKLAKESENLLAVYENYKVISAPAYQIAAEDLKKIKVKAQEIEEWRKSVTVPLDTAKKRIMDFVRYPLERLAKAEGIIKQAMLSFQQEQDRLRREQEEKLRKKAEEEEARKRKALEEKAKAAEAKGDIEKAETLREKAEEVYIPAPIVPDQTPKVQGISTRTIWRYRVIDFNKIPRDYLIPNDKLLSDFATATKGKVPIEGIEFYSEDILASSTK